MTQINILLSGFSENDTGKFQQIFNFSKSRNPSYMVCSDSPDIILVNALSQSAIESSLSYIEQHPETTLVTVGRATFTNLSVPNIAPPYITSRVLRLLDQISAQKHDEAKASKNTEKQTEPATQNTVNQYNVLVVDDSPSMQKMLEIELSQVELNINTEFADSGEEALEKTANKHYDFIFLDIMMPGIDGYEVCKTIRKKPEEKKTPIIMLSGKTSPLDEVKGVIAGCTTYLTKPIEHNEFQNVIKRITKWLDHKRPTYQAANREVEHC